MWRTYAWGRLEAVYVALVGVNGIGCELLAQHMLHRYDSATAYIMVLLLQQVLNVGMVAALRDRLSIKVQDFLCAQYLQWKQALWPNCTGNEIRMQTADAQSESFRWLVLDTVLTVEAVALPLVVCVVFVVQLTLRQPIALAAPALMAALYHGSVAVVPQLPERPFEEWDRLIEDHRAGRQVHHEHALHGESARSARREAAVCHAKAVLDREHECTDRRENARFVTCAMIGLLFLAPLANGREDIVLFVRNFASFISTAAALGRVAVLLRRTRRERGRLLREMAELDPAPEKTHVAALPTWHVGDELCIANLRTTRNSTGTSTFTLCADYMCLRRGARYLLDGVSGAGKSTLLDMLGGVTPASEYTLGSATLGGTPIGSLQGMLHQRVYVSQGVKINHRDSIAQVVSGEVDEAGAHAHLDTVRRALEISEAAGFAAHKDLFAHFPGLSGGERSRIVLARCLFRALRTGPPLIVLDEIDDGIEQSLALRVFDNIFTAFPQQCIVVVAHTDAVKRRADWWTDVYNVVAVQCGGQKEGGALSVVTRR